MIRFKEKDLAGSRLRCLMITSQGKRQVTDILNKLINGYGYVDPTIHSWQPGGFLKPKEVQLGRMSPFLTEDQNKQLKDWWLAIDETNSGLPNWDIVSQATIDNRPGLVLIEAKAHTDELAEKDKSQAKEENLNSIRKSMEEASNSLNEMSFTGWNLQPDNHYQLCNRFAWSWKLAQMEVPIILIYLGFLNAGEMADRNKTTFINHEDWLQTVYKYSNGTIPEKAWNQIIPVNNTSIRAIIRSIDINYSVGNEDINVDD